MRYVTGILAGLAFFATLLNDADVSATSKPSGPSQIHGSIVIWLTPGSEASGRVLITGVIAAAGTTFTSNSSGKRDSNGRFEALVFKSGSILLNETAFDQKLRTAIPFAYNPENCSVVIQIEGSVPIARGTGAFAGIVGGIGLLDRTGEILPKLKDGTCNRATTAHLAAQVSALYGYGTIG